MVIINKEIKSLGEIDFTTSQLVSFNATVIDMLSEGDNDKKPFRATLKLEESGETISISSWKFENLDVFKRLVYTDEVYSFEGQAGTFGNYGQQIRIGNIRSTGLRSTKKILKAVNPDAIKAELQLILNKYIPSDSIYAKLIKKLVLTNDKFWKWPAATKVHHAYPGGLAKHSLNVLKNTISIWQNYQGSNLDIKLLVAGAILHDIGKMSEYDIDGKKTIFGSFIPHIISGYTSIVKTAISLGYDPDTTKELVMLSHVILSHHDKLEFGSPVSPYIAEAVIVSRADALDAVYESIDSTLDGLNLNESSDRLLSLDGNKIFKWK